MARSNIIRFPGGGGPNDGDDWLKTTPTSPVEKAKPFLWIVPEDLFYHKTAAELRPVLSEKFQCETWLLADNRALAISFPDVLAKQWIPVDIADFEQAANPCFGFLNQFLVPVRDACSPFFWPERLNASVPNPCFCIQILLPHGEIDKRYCMHMSSELTSFAHFGLRACAKRLLQPADLERMKKFIFNWCETAASRPSNGQILDLGKLDWTRYQSPGNPECYPQDGYVFSCERYTPVTWPWVELYLAIRRNFPKRQRFSLEFINIAPPNEEA